MPVAPRKLILDLLSTARGNAMPVRALVEAGALFEISDNSLRVALARLRARGRVERDEWGRYRLAAGSLAVQRHVAAWPRLEQRMVAWRGGWIGLQMAGLRPRSRTRLRRCDRAIEFFGFRPLARDFFVRPDNLRGELDELRASLYGLGVDPRAPVFAMSDLDRDTERRAGALWDGRALAASYEKGRRVLLRSTERLGSLSSRHALVETFEVGGRALRQLAFDPLLPEQIVPAAPRQAFVGELRRYDRLGRRYWGEFMRAHGLRGLDSPLRNSLIDPTEPPALATRSSP